MKKYNLGYDKHADKTLLTTKSPRIRTGGKRHGSLLCGYHSTLSPATVGTKGQWTGVKKDWVLGKVQRLWGGEDEHQGLVVRVLSSLVKESVARGCQIIHQSMMVGSDTIDGNRTLTGIGNRIIHVLIVCWVTRKFRFNAQTTSIVNKASLARNHIDHVLDSLNQYMIDAKTQSSSTIGFV
ncbi:hypothetical protein BC941DRAFT_464612 [Chlamydoabsidia padenii]|nr:hypothetical protein BC941DRAFT_464612 [Chlamydoabsidia padenii]